MEYDILDPVISIGTLAEKVGLSPSAIRKYEEDGLIIPHRTHSGQRVFCYEDIGRIKNIQYLIKNLGINIEGIRRLQALVPCWSLLPCKIKERDTCSAYRDHTKPCWTIKDAHCSIQGNECRQCIVYRYGSLCVEDIKDILHHQDKNWDPETAIKNITFKKRDNQQEEK
jgi:MerR family transcriptional regulator/heat shock protein HspR